MSPVLLQSHPQTPRERTWGLEGLTGVPPRLLPHSWTPSFLPGPEQLRSFMPWKEASASATRLLGSRGEVWAVARESVAACSSSGCLPLCPSRSASRWCQDLSMVILSIPLSSDTSSSAAGPGLGLGQALPALRGSVLTWPTPVSAEACFMTLTVVSMPFCTSQGPF